MIYFSKVCKRLLFLLFLLISIDSVYAQRTQRQFEGNTQRSGIIDDSTKLVYGPKTTLSISESDLFYETFNWQTVDTTLTDFYKFTFLEKKNMKWTNLGVIGTPLRPLFHEPSYDIGARTGQDGLTPYFKAPKDFKYFDTKSPYIEFSLLLGGKGRSITNVLVSRNVTPQLNFGIHLQKMSIDKQIGSVIEGDRNATNTSFDGFGSFHTKNNNYWIVANYSRMKHIVYETGGVDPASVNRFRSYFNDDAEYQMTGPQSRERRWNIHTYQELRVLSSTKLYHTFDRYLQQNKFVHLIDPGDPIQFFDNLFINADTTQDKTEFDYYKNQGGIKGRLGPLFYDVYYKNRLTNFAFRYADSLNLDFDTRKSEHYLGGELQYNLDDLNRLGFSGEYLIDGNYKIEANLISKWGKAQFFNSRYQPGIIYRSYFGNHDKWNNNFKDPIFLRISAEGKIKLGRLELEPGASFTQISHYLYFNKDTIPAQATNNVGYLTPKLDFNIRLPWHFNWQSEIIYTHFLNKTSDFVNIPKFLVNGHLYYRNKLAKGAFDTQIGAKVYWQEDYYADNYYPILQQFFYQDNLKVLTSLKIDLYLSFRVRSALVFFKFVNLKQMLFGEGNLVGPNYPQQRNALDFGFTWYFYD